MPTIGYGSGMTQILAIFIGGGFGAISRYGVSVAALRFAGPGFPLGTLVANILGCLGIGLVFGFLARHGGADWAKPLLVTGFLGGFTTFSTFSIDAFSLWERGEAFAAFGYVLASVVLSIAAVFAGLAFSRSIWA